MLTIGHTERQELRSELERHSSKYEADAGEEDVLAAFRLLRKGVCRPDFPGQYTTQYYTVMDVLHNLMTLSKILKDSGKVTSLSGIHDFCFDFVHDLIQQGPGTTHMQLWKKMLSDSDFGFKVYYHSLTGSKLKKHILFLKREYRSQGQGTAWDGFKSTFDACMKQLIDKQNLSGRAFAEAQAEFIELYLHAHLGFISREKEVREFHDHLALLICNNYDYRNVFVGLKDSGHLTHLLKQIEDIICQTNLTTEDCDAVVKRLHDVVKMLLTVIKDGHIYHKVYGDILDFVAVICDTKAGSPIHSIVEAVGSFYYNINSLQGNSEMFTVITTKLIDFLTNLDDHTLMRVHYVDYAIHPVLHKAMDKTLPPAHCRLTIDLIKACIRIYQPRTIEAAKMMMYETQDKMQWKDHLKDACDLFDLLTQVQVIGDDKQTREYCSNFSELTDHFGYLLEREEVLPKMIEKIVDFSLTLLEKREPKLFKAAREAARRIGFKGRYHKGVIISTLARVLPLLEDPRFDWTDEDACKTVEVLAGVGMRTLTSKTPDEKEFNILTKFFRAVLKDGLVGEDPKKKVSMRYHLFHEQGSTFIQLLDNPGKIQRALSVVRCVISLTSHQNPKIAEKAMWQVHTLVGAGAKVMAQFFQQILTAFINTEHYFLIVPLCTLYCHNPDLLESQFEAVFTLIDFNCRNKILQWLVKIAKKQPFLFTEKHLARLIDEMLQDDDRQQVLYLDIMDGLSSAVPGKFIPHMERLIDMEPSSEFAGNYTRLQVLTNVAVSSKDEAECERVMAFLEKKIRGPEEERMTVSYLIKMSDVGDIHRHVLESRKPALEDLRERSTVATTKGHCTHIFNVLEGKVQNLALEIMEVKEDVEKLDVRVTNTEEGLVQVNQELGQQKGELDEVKHNVKEQVEKMGQLEETVDDTKAKVEELDEKVIILELLSTDPPLLNMDDLELIAKVESTQILIVESFSDDIGMSFGLDKSNILELKRGKTLSHAPFWSRDVTRLLNPESFLDWTHLSSRLGYTNDDIRSWAQMHDPCMAMLNEWYATRKTREATDAVLTALQEMDRMDAAVIVENAMKMTEVVVKDEEFEYPEPPEVFISYQWGIQNEVKLLKLHLEKAGFTCWMDIGQMGGGDKLFEKIDKGIRAAKIIICCVTEKYTKSPNGIREVNLSVSLSKPIIPLLMEKLSWPPPGSMGPIFSEYLFIRFFTRPEEETGDVRYWSAAKFQELLMQVNYNNVKRDEKKVGKEYKNWWCPVAEVIKIEKKDVKAMTTSSQKKQREVERGAASPDIFISYQWGKQKQIQLMYKRLTEMGFTVWMDIYQMGGGDSLYDKIDKGMRGAKVVLSCVTSKYSLSANCRREVTLADALKKPIVPLLLEKMTWPPSGPMSMVFTQLLYINFTKDKSVQDRWSGKKFNELLIKLNQYVPDIILFGKEDEETEVNASPYPEETPAVGDTLDTTPQSQDNTTTVAEQMPDVSD